MHYRYSYQPFVLFRQAGAVLFLILLSACQSQVTSEVTRFHRLFEPRGETVAILPLDEAKSGSLEFSSHAALAAQKLEELGYQVIESGQPDLWLKFDYGVGPPQTQIRSWPRNTVHYHYYFGRFHPYYFGAYWDEPRVYSYTIYTRSLDMRIETDTGEVVFEGRVRSVGQESNINRVMEYLMSAIFQNFPGESGVTKVVTIRNGENRRPL